MKKLLTVLLAVLMVLTLAGCGGKEEPAPAPEEVDLTGKPLRILQFVSQSLGSLSCEDLVYEGIKQFCDETGSTVETFELNNDDSRIAAQLTELCGSGKYDVVHFCSDGVQTFDYSAEIMSIKVVYVVNCKNFHWWICSFNHGSHQ